MRAWVLALALAISGCASTPPPQPLPPILPAPVVCEVPQGMTEPEAAPVRPSGEYTQKDVAAYIAALHRWGARGWARLDAVRAWSEDCVEREGVSWK